MWPTELFDTQIRMFLSNKMEVAAFILGVWSVYLVVKRSVWAFPIGIVMVALYAVIFFEAQLYSDMLLQVFFAVMQAAGWYQWLHSPKQDDQKIAVRLLSLRQISLTVFAILGITLTLGYTMDHFTTTDVPYADAFTTAISVMAQWWLNLRYLENWHLWIFVDVLYIGLYWYKALYLTAVLYVVFLVLAVIGLREWRAQKTE
jgi:nicotinamide mononucleotide transporter